MSVRDEILSLIRDPYETEFRSALQAALLKDPTTFPGEVRSWLPAYIELSGVRLPLSNITGGDASALRVGMGFLWFTDTAPDFSILLQGQDVTDTDYPELSTLWGKSGTWAVPDLQQRFPLGKAASGTGSTLLGTGGTIDHTHSVSGTTSGSSSFNNFDQTTPASAAASNGHTHTFSVTSGGGNPPFFAVNFGVRAL